MVFIPKSEKSLQKLGVLRHEGTPRYCTTKTTLILIDHFMKVLSIGLGGQKLCEIVHSYEEGQVETTSSSDTYLFISNEIYMPKLEP